MAVALALVLLTGVLYAPVAHFEFLDYDDQDYVWRNPDVQRGLSWPGLWWAWTTTHAGNRHPLTWLSHMVDCEVFGSAPPDAGWHHLHNVALHGLNAALVFLLWRSLTGQFYASAVMGLLFAVHPLAVEPTAWISERKTLLAFALGLASLLAYVQFARRRGRGWYVASLVFLALGLAAKQTIVTIPCLMLLLDFWPLGRMRLESTNASGRSDRARLKRSVWLVVEKLPFFGLVAIASAAVLDAQTLARASLADLPLGQRLANAAVAYVMYLRQALWPTDMAVLYPHPRGTLPPSLVVGSLLILGVVTGVAVACWRKWPFVTVGWLWFLGSVVPMLGLIQVGQQSRADRYTYGPLIGIYLIVVWTGLNVAARWPRWRLALCAACALAVVGLAAVTSRQLSYWQNTGTLFAHALSVNADNAIAHVHVARSRRAADDLPGAIAHLEKAAALAPEQADVWLQMAQLRVMLAEIETAPRRQLMLERAHHDLDRGLVLEPASAFGQFWRGKAFLVGGRLPEAERAFRAAIDGGLRTTNALFNLAVAQLNQGRRQEGLESLEAALTLSPGDEQIRAMICDELRQLADAAARANEPDTERELRSKLRRYEAGRPPDGARQPGADARPQRGLSRA